MAEGARLESVYRFIPIEGSNPSLTAIIPKNRGLEEVHGFFMPNGHR